MTGMRLNLSHTTLADSASYIRNYQNAATEMGIKAQVLIDMQGPELRMGKLEEPLILEQGETWIPMPEAVMNVLEIGDEVLLDDGKILVQVVDFSKEKQVRVQVIRGGILQSHKSIKVVGKHIILMSVIERALTHLCHEAVAAIAQDI